jgi:hypothetical protein
LEAAYTDLHGTRYRTRSTLRYDRGMRNARVIKVVAANGSRQRQQAGRLVINTGQRNNRLWEVRLLPEEPHAE